MNTHEIQSIRDQFLAGQWMQFVKSIEISGLRGWTGQTISFSFPIITIIGENGSGKSTILKAVASIYEGANKDATYYPSDFFQDTQWDNITGVRIVSQLKHGDRDISYRITKATERWNFADDRPKRKVYFQDISRTLPLDATAGYAKIAKLAKSEVSSQDLEASYLKNLSFVMGRTYSSARFAKTDVSSRDVGLLRREFGEVSQYHQGAGEDATLDLFKMLQGIPPQSLLIIDEVEASLHPKAQRRLIHQLIELCRVKKVQIITSTHSPYILEELPPEARILIVPGPQGNNVIYNSTSEFALSRIDDPVHPDMSIFVEDKNSETLLKEIILSADNGSDIISRIEFSPVGPASVVCSGNQKWGQFYG